MNSRMQMAVISATSLPSPNSARLVVAASAGALAKTAA
jgi:hypothetical protein